jgi:hydroxymethylbilane synthase
VDVGRKIVIGSRGSDLALWQAEFTKTKLEAFGHSVKIEIIRTKGDVIQHLSFDKIEGKGFFTKELEEALLSGEIDLAVHSHKDLPTTYPDGLTIAGVSYREDSTESLLILPEAIDLTKILKLKTGAIVGTSSARRKSQLIALRPDLIIKDLRGNVPTRVSKLKSGEYDAIVLASAGLNRLSLELGTVHREIIPQQLMIPAPAQGVLAYQIRSDDTEMSGIVEYISDQQVQQTIDIERTVLNRLEGGCLLPLGVYCEYADNGFQAWASLQPLNGSAFRRAFVRGNNPQILSITILNVLTRVENRAVYISRNSEDAELFMHQLTNFGFKVIAKSPVRFETISWKDPGHYDWLFFTSKQCVRHFFSQKIAIDDRIRLAAMGSGTASLLKQFGIVPEFIGKDRNPLETAADFGNLAEKTTVLFPIAENGLRSVQQAVSRLVDVKEVPVYRMVAAPIERFISAEIYVFTSPSAVRSFFLTQPEISGLIVAIGSATESALNEVGYADVLVAPFSSEQALADLVCGLL